MEWAFAVMRVVLVIAIATALYASPSAGADWMQFGYDVHHGGFNTSERGYSTATGNRLVYQAELPHQVDSTPIFLNNVDTAAGVRDLLFVVALDGTLMALDAADGALVWSQQPPATLYSSQYTTGAPAIDPNRAFVYAYGLDGYVHKYSVSDGVEFVGSGWPEVSTLKPDDEKVESALTIATGRNGAVHLYAVTGSNFDGGDYQGHLTTIDLSASPNTQTVFNGQCSELGFHLVKDGVTSGAGRNDCPHSDFGSGGLWSMSGATYDGGTDRVFITTANGPFDPSNTSGLGHNWSDSIIALKADGSSTSGQPLDSFTPTSAFNLGYFDADLGISSVVVLPTPTRSNVADLGAQFGKDGCLRLLNLENLSGVGAPGHTGGAIQSQSLFIGYDACSTGERSGGPLIQPAVWVDPTDGSTWLYISGYAYQVVLDLMGHPSLIPAWQSMSGSSPVVANGEVYLVSDSLLALDARTGETIWSTPSITSSPDDAVVGVTHWATPIVVNGRLYIVDEFSPDHTGSSRLSVIALDGVYKNAFENP